MTTVHLIFDDEELDVNKDILMKFDYFRNLFDISQDNIKINNIDITTFKQLISMWDNEANEKNIMTLADFLGCNSLCKSMTNYKCGLLTCNKIALNGSFCDCHKCSVEGCENGSAHKYCLSHKCGTYGCTNIHIEKGLYCINHTCSIDMCINYSISDYVFCREHKCLIGTCPNVKSYYSCFCETHICAYLGCTKGAPNKYCSSHICVVANCFNVRSSEKLCKEHSCKVIN